MKPISSRRNFLAAGLALPAAGLATTSSRPANSSTAAFSPSKETAKGFEYRILGKTGLKVTSVGFGCMVTSDASVVEKAADIGITYFDTARVYQQGNNERMVGAALKGKRNKLTLSSKSVAKTRAEALEHLDTSLKELGTDHLDIWYLHSKSKPEEVTDDLMEAQEMAKRQGKIRFAGISMHSGQAGVFPVVLRHKDHFDVVLTSYNFAMEGMDALIQSLADAKLGIVAMKVMAGGSRRIKPGEKAGEILKKDGAMLAALKWAIKNKNVNTSVPGITDMDQLDENLKAMSNPFTAGDGRLLSARLNEIGPTFCRMCGECDGSCPKNLPVADVLRFLMYAEGYGEFSLGREHFLQLSSAVKEVRCNACPTCTVECKYGVRVAERMIRAQELLA
jgi:predicted aldo/keto reductase-like oxidoreductase